MASPQGCRVYFRHVQIDGRSCRVFAVRPTDCKKGESIVRQAGWEDEV